MGFRLCSQRLPRHGSTQCVVFAAGPLVRTLSLRRSQFSGLLDRRLSLNWRAQVCFRCSLLRATKGTTSPVPFPSRLVRRVDKGPAAKTSSSIDLNSGERVTLFDEFPARFSVLREERNPSIGGQVGSSAIGPRDLRAPQAAEIDFPPPFPTAAIFLPQKVTSSTGQIAIHEVVPGCDN